MILITLFFGLILRLWGIGIPDIATDEAQFILGATAAHPPLGIRLFESALALHHSIIAARSVSIVTGFLTIGVLFLIARRLTTLRTAGLVAAVAAIFPGHIVFSKLAYLDPLLTLAWLLTVLTLEQARAQKEHTNDLSLLFLWAAAVASTFIKTQGFLFPLALLLLRLWEMRKHRPWHDPIAGILILSLLPIFLYLPTHPSILATLQLYGGTMFGIQNMLTRILELFLMQWQMLLFLLPLGILSISSLRQCPISLRMLCLLAALQPLILGPNHIYYATALVIFALPIGLLLTRLPRIAQDIALILCIGSALLVQIQPKTTYWNTHADTINALVTGEKQIVAVGGVGHHIRWYLRPEVLVGNTMDLSQWNGVILDLGTDLILPESTIVYQDERIRLLSTIKP